MMVFRPNKSPLSTLEKKIKLYKCLLKSMKCNSVVTYMSLKTIVSKYKMLTALAQINYFFCVDKLLAAA